jgi:hypothetical protein
MVWSSPKSFNATSLSLKKKMWLQRWAPLGLQVGDFCCAAATAAGLGLAAVAGGGGVQRIYDGGTGDRGIRP